jgi:cell shape-determining protein MreC
MKKIFLLTICSASLIGCNPNPSKEARIQKLETEMTQSIQLINQLKDRVQVLEDSNKQLKTRIMSVEKQYDLSATNANE